MEEYKFQLIITPETYDYGDEEIVYRIYFDEQLISERSLPLLKLNEAIVDIFFISAADSSKKHKINFFNLKNKKAKIKCTRVNDFLMHSCGNFSFKNLKIVIKEIK